MKLLGVRTIPLSAETFDAWKSVGVKFMKRDRNPSDIEKTEQIFRRGNYDAILNLGFRGQLPDVPVINHADTITSVSRPGELRETLPDYLPRGECDTKAHWIKKPGWRGEGKEFHEYSCDVDCFTLNPPPRDGLWPTAAGPNRRPPTGWDIQEHVEGTEYRVNTVGDTVIQAHKKRRQEDGSFEWTWVGVQGINQSGIIPLIKEAVPKIPRYERSFLGFDIIVSTRPYIIEVNTCPGVNEATAERFRDVIARVL